MILADAYEAIKSTHIYLIFTSGFLFALRGLTIMAGVGIAMRPAVRYLSYLIDSFLLASAVLLLVTLRLNPFTTPWLAAKLLLILAYIVFGSLALRRAPTRLARAVAFAAAIVLFAMIYLVARSHDPLGWLALSPHLW